MTTYHGKDGIVKVGTHAVAEVDNWSVNENAKTADDTSMGDTWETHIPGKTINNWECSLDCHYDDTDDDGQETLAVGASVTLNLYPVGAGASAAYKTGTATITSITLPVRKDGVVSRSFKCQGNGALTGATVGA